MGVVTDWNFTKHLPDNDDVAAEVKAWEKYANRWVGPTHSDESERILDFAAGFYRGISWSEHKTKTKGQDE